MSPKAKAKLTKEQEAEILELARDWMANDSAYLALGKELTQSRIALRNAMEAYGIPALVVDGQVVEILSSNLLRRPATVLNG